MYRVMNACQRNPIDYASTSLLSANWWGPIVRAPIFFADLYHGAPLVEGWLRGILLVVFGW